MSKSAPQHAAVWFEIPVTDMARAKSFYTQVLGAGFKDEDLGATPTAVFDVKDTASGVAGHLYPGKPAGAGTGPTIHLAAPKPLESALARVPENGGKVVSEIVTIPAGRFAYCLDPDGNSVGLFTHS